MRSKRRTSAADQIDVLIYGGVCREYFEPATACRVASCLGVGPEAAVYDVSNACLGVLNGMVEIANRIELGQIRAGMVVSCETAREINEIVIEQMLENPEHGFLQALAGDADRRLGGGRRVAHRRLVLGIEGPAGCWAGRSGRRPSITASAAGASRRPSRAIRPLPSVHLDRRGGGAHPRRRAGHADLARLLAAPRLGSTARSTR